VFDFVFIIEKANTRLFVIWEREKTVEVVGLKIGQFCKAQGNEGA